MCAAFELNQIRIRPGQLVPIWGATGALRFRWAGFARRETLAWWMRKGGEVVDIPAHRFAERSDRDRQLRWDDVPAGWVIRGLIDPHDGAPLLKVVTRAASVEEIARFEHDRMPVLEAPLYSCEAIPIPVEPADQPSPVQGELF